MLNAYLERTFNHIDRVIKYGKKINKDYTDHDRDKLTVDKIIIPYIFMNWQKNNDNTIIIPDEIQKGIDTATRCHILANSHHPEYWDDEAKENTKGFTRKDPNPNGIYDATKMPNEALDEMCCDWCAMSEEFNEKTPKDWADKTINKRWKFTDKQKEYIYNMLKKLWKK
jgi:hypothetical protein